jgi:hypothetical protein
MSSFAGKVLKGIPARKFYCHSKIRTALGKSADLAERDKKLKTACKMDLPVKKYNRAAFRSSFCPSGLSDTRCQVETPSHKELS